VTRRRRGCLAIALIAILLTAGVAVFAVGGGFVDWNPAHYAAWYEAKAERGSPMPRPDELADAERVRFQRYTGNFWGEAAYIVIARYDAATYARRKAELDEQIAFQTELIAQRDGPAIEPSFRMDGFDMRFAKLGEEPYQAEVPEDMYFVGTADQAHEILYVYYDDVNLDVLLQPIEAALPELIRWTCVTWPDRLPLLERMRVPKLR